MQLASVHQAIRHAPALFKSKPIWPPTEKAVALELLPFNAEESSSLISSSYQAASSLQPMAVSQADAAPSHGAKPASPALASAAPISAPSVLTSSNLEASEQITEPITPKAHISSSGNTVTGTATPGLTVLVRDANGVLLGSGKVTPDGTFSVLLRHALTNGESFEVFTRNATGKVSEPVLEIAPDLFTVRPLEGFGLISDIELSEGVVISGTGAPGNLIQISLGNQLFEQRVNEQGQWSVPLNSNALKALSKGWQDLPIVMLDDTGYSATEHVSLMLTAIQPSRMGTDHFSVGFYTSQSSKADLLSHSAELQLLTRLGPNYGSSISPGTNNFTTEEWKILHDLQLQTAFLFQFPTGTTIGGSPVAGTDIPAFLKTLYDTIYAQTSAVLSDPIKSSVVSSWYAFEEIRYWNTSDMSAATTFVTAIRDAEKDAGVASRPVFEYQPQHADANRVNSYHDLFSVITKGAYIQVGDTTIYDTILRASKVIVDGSRADDATGKNTGTIGWDYTPFITLGAHIDPKAGVTLAEFSNEIRTGAYLAITQGIQGIDVWSYALRTGFTDTWRSAYLDAYASLGKELNVLEPHLGKAIVNGWMFDPLTSTSPLQFSSTASTVQGASFFYNGEVYLVLVNTSFDQSAEVRVQVNSGLQGYQEVLTDALQLGHRVEGPLSLKLGAEGVRIIHFTPTYAEVATVIGINRTIKTDSGLTSEISDYGTTRDSTPELSGIAPNGKTVEVFDDGVLIGSTQASQGIWTFSTPSLAEGSHSIHVEVIDDTGKAVASNEIHLQVDLSVTPATITPEIGTDKGVTENIQAGDYTRDSTLALSGTVEAGSLVEVFDGSNLIASSNTIAGVGKLQVTGTTWSGIAKWLTNGTHSLTVKFTDAVGNTKQLDPFDVTIDTSPPSSNLIYAKLTNHGDNAKAYSNQNATFYLVNTLQTDITVESLANLPRDMVASAQHVFNPGKPEETTNIPTTGLVAGTYVMYAVDRAGNLSKVSPNKVQVMDGYTLHDSYNGVNVEGWKLIMPYTVNGKTFYYLDKDGYGYANTVDRLDHNTLDLLFNANSSEGAPLDTHNDNRLNAQLLSAFGQSLLLPTGNTTAGTLADNQSYVQDLSALWDSVSTTSQMSGTPPGWLSSYYWTASTRGKDSHAVISLAKGYVTNAPDTNLNYVVLEVAAVSIDLSIATDTGLLPQIAAGGSTRDTSLGLSGTAPMAVSVDVFDGDTYLGMAPVDKGTWTFQTPELQMGVHSLTARKTDWTGNTVTSAPMKVTVDTRVELASVSDTLGTDTGFTSSIKWGESTKDNTIALSGTAEAKSTIEVFDGSTLVGSTNSITGVRKLTYSTAEEWGGTINWLSSGRHELTIKVTDAVGNTLTLDSFSVTIDTSPPSSNLTAAVLTNHGDVATAYSNENATFYLVNTSQTDISAASLASLSRSKVASAQHHFDPLFPSKTTTISTTGLEAGTYVMYAVDAAGNLSKVSPNTVKVLDGYTLHGSYNGINVEGWNLIAPYSLNGKTFYYLDKDGYGSASTADRLTHQELDLLFNSTSTDKNAVDTNNANRSNVALLSSFELTMSLPTSSASGSITADNGAYATDFPAIWDSLNTGAGTSGTPNGWMSNFYWSATATSIPEQHRAFRLSSGETSSSLDTNLNYIALELSRTAGSSSPGLPVLA